MANTSIKAAFERLWQHVVAQLGDKANIDHNHNEMYYTESEVDSKISTVNTSITNITNGSVTVKEAEHATSADTAGTATTATSATKATQDGNGKVISNTYETKTDASAKLDEAKVYADTVSSSAANTVKNDLLNGAGAAYDTLKELGDLIDVNVDAIDALNDVAANKADAEHTHEITDVSGLQDSLDEISALANESDVFIVNISGRVNAYSADKTFTEIKAAYESGKVVSALYNGTIAPLSECFDEDMSFIKASGRSTLNIYIYSDELVEVFIEFLSENVYDSLKGVSFANISTTDKTIVGAINELDAEIGSHNHDDVYYTQSQVDTKLDSKADSSHTHAISDITNLQTTLNNAASAISSNTSSINAHSDRIAAVETLIGEGFEAITSQEISNLFAN